MLSTAGFNVLGAGQIWEIWLLQRLFTGLFVPGHGPRESSTKTLIVAPRPLLSNLTTIHKQNNRREGIKHVRLRLLGLYLCSSLHMAQLLKNKEQSHVVAYVEMLILLPFLSHKCFLILQILWNCRFCRCLNFCFF